MLSFISIFCVLAASLSSLSLGLDVGMISSTLVQPTFISYFENPSSAAIGGIVAAFSAGGGFGAYGCALVADPFGRLWGLFGGALIALVGCGLQSGAVHVAMLIVGRLVTGFGAGMLIAVFPVYASEVAPPQIRGALGGLQMLMIEAAIFIATGTGYGFGINFTSDAQWRGPLAVQAIPLVLLIPITFILPESPRWLISKGKNEQAMKVLRRLHQGSNSEAFVQGEYQEIQDQIAAEKELFQATWTEIAKKPSWRKRIILAVGLQIFSQLTGINCIQYYAASIYERLGFSTYDSLRLNLIYGAMGLLFAVFWVTTLDRMSRIGILTVSTLFMGAALLVQSVLSAVYEGGTNANNNALNAQVAMFFVFNLFFVAVGMLSWLIPPELCPMVIRAKANSISVSANYFVGLLVAEVSPIALSAIGFKFFYVFVASDIIAALCYYFLYPDTSKLTLEEIDVKFGDQIVEHVLQEKPQQGETFHHEEIVAEHNGK